jgi:two-component system nitrate/nitrite response regulator NarL
MRRRRFVTVLVGLNTLSREGLRRILNTADFRVIAVAPNVESLLLNLPTQEQLVLLVIDIGDNPSGVIDQIKLFKKRFPFGRIAVLADRYLPSRDMLLAFGAGVNAYFVKVATCDTFIKSLELIALGETILPSAILPYLTDHGETSARDAARVAEIPVEGEHHYRPQLSARERSILRCLLGGDSNKAIARKFDIAEATVKVHIKCILRKIRVNNRTQAAIWAMHHESLTSGIDHFNITQTISTPVPLVKAIQERGAPEPPAPLSGSAPPEDAARPASPTIRHLVRIGAGRRSH